MNMGLFTKEEKIHFERDEAGNVIKVTKNGQPYQSPPVMKSSKQLEREYYEKHPEKKHPGLKKLGRGFKRLDSAIVKYNRERNIFVTGRGKPMQSFDPLENMFGIQPIRKTKKKKGKTKYTIISGKAYPIAGTGKKKKKGKKKRRPSGFGDFDVLDNSGFFK